LVLGRVRAGRAPRLERVRELGGFAVGHLEGRRLVQRAPGAASARRFGVDDERDLGRVAQRELAEFECRGFDGGRVADVDGAQRVREARSVTRHRRTQLACAAAVTPSRIRM
jgi:hypothetical protein